MAEIQRWICAEGDGGAEMWRDSDGEYVFYADHAAAIAELEAKCETLKREAQIHAQEARTQKSTVFDCYKAAGVTGKADWNGAEPVRAAMAEKDAEIERLTQELAAMTNDRNLWQDDHNGDCPNVAKLIDAQQQIAALKEENERLKAPVSDEEWGAHCEDYLVPQSVRNDLPEHDNEGGSVHEEALSRKSFDTLIAARSEK